jgi:hypothetical protein
MIEQLKTYRVTCDGTLTVMVGAAEKYRRCNETCEVQATSKDEALRSLPDGWHTAAAFAFGPTFCQRMHRDEQPR